ncbi:MAG: flagellar basal body protein [Bacteroidota bacterium]
METKTINLLRRAMLTYNMRTQTTASNLANLDTPGYERMGVSFEEALRDARNGVTLFDQTEGLMPNVEVDEGPPILEDEMMELSDTQMRVQLATRALSDKFSLLRTGITGRPG